VGVSVAGADGDPGFLSRNSGICDVLLNLLSNSLVSADLCALSLDELTLVSVDLSMSKDLVQQDLFTHERER
jgi:hypothetical protein